jgi:zinc transporter
LTGPAPSRICGFDIWTDGTATSAPDTSVVAPENAVYRWLHFDLAEPELARWCATQLPPMAARSLLAAKTRPRVDDQDNGLVLTLRGINLNEGAELTDMVSLRMWVTPRLVVTVRRMRMFAMDDLRHDIESGDAPAIPARMIARIIENIVDRIETVSVNLEEQADRMEELVYDQHVLQLPELAPLHRTVIKLRRHIGPLSDALDGLARMNTQVIPPELRHRLRDTANRVTRSVEEVVEVRDRVQTLTSHLDLANSARLGRNGYVLSVIAAIFLPLGFLTGLFGVNVAGLPGTAYPHAFAVLCGAMVVLALAIYLLLRWIRWF